MTNVDWNGFGALIISFLTLERKFSFRLECEAKPSPLES
jgi:hypothetical protein